MADEHILDYLDETGCRKAKKKMFETIFEYTLAVLKKEGNFEVSLSLVSKEEIHKLNKQYRDMDRPTDVLTFAFTEADYVEDEPIVDLGSIIICPEIAVEQAKNFHHPFLRELSFLFIHGLLHSFGYDHHGSEEQAQEMFSLQNHILNTLPLDFYTNLTQVKKQLYKAQSQSISPYSHFQVGAVVTTKDGKKHLGMNIENSAYPVTICAERCALFSTYALGYKKEDIASLALITSSSEIGTPCGSCRQVMSELMDSHCPVYIFNKDETKMLKMSVKELLPYAFTEEELNA